MRLIEPITNVIVQMHLSNSLSLVMVIVCFKQIQFSIHSDDHNRVVLDTGSDNLSDYINASYVSVSVVYNSDVSKILRK